MIGMWLSLAVPPALMVAAVLMGRLEGFLLGPRSAIAGQAEEQLSAQPVASAAEPAPAAERRPRVGPLGPAERVAPLRPIRAA